jgi:hypothetical protein
MDSLEARGYGNEVWEGDALLMLLYKLLQLLEGLASDRLQVWVGTFERLD